MTTRNSNAPDWMNQAFEEAFDQEDAFGTFRERNTDPETMTRFFGPDMGAEFRSFLERQTTAESAAN